MKQVFTLNLYKTLFLAILTTTSVEVFAQSNWVKIGTGANGKPIMLSPTGKTFVSPNYEPFAGNYRGTSTSTAVVVGSNGAVSNGTVKATITQQVGKRPVIDEILKKARTGGKMLGKGAAKLGKSAMSLRGGIYGIAFSLALDALIDSDSGFFWDEDKGDFVRKSDEYTYTVMRVDFDKRRYTYVQGQKWTKDEYKDYCAFDCQKITTVRAESFSEVIKVMNEYCKTQTYISDNKQYHYDSFSMQTNQCRDEQKSILGNFEVFAEILDFDLVPITEDEFFKEAEPDADKKPNEWVETSEVKPKDEPKVEVPAGTIAQSDPYTDPKDRKVKQTRWEFDGKGRAREIVIERPDLTPDSPEAPELKPPVEETPKDGDKDKEKEKSDTEDLCEKNPNILACDKQPETPELEELPEIPTEEVNLRFQPDSIFPNAGQCPEPVSFQAMGATYQISTQPICDVAEKMRPFIIALAYLAAAFFVIRVIKSETA